MKSKTEIENLELPLPQYNHSTELLRKVQDTRFHGELVVTLTSEGTIHLTVYEIRRKIGQTLGHKTYLIFGKKEDEVLG